MLLKLVWSLTKHFLLFWQILAKQTTQGGGAVASSYSQQVSTTVAKKARFGLFSVAVSHQCDVSGGCCCTHVEAGLADGAAAVQSPSKRPHSSETYML